MQPVYCHGTRCLKVNPSDEHNCLRSRRTGVVTVSVARFHTDRTQNIYKYSLPRAQGYIFAQDLWANISEFPSLRQGATLTENALLVEVPEHLPCPRSTATRIIECPARRDGEPLRGKTPFPVLRNGIDGRRSRIPCLAEFARVKTYSSGLITPKAGWSIRFFAKQSSLVDETGIEPATSSLRTVGKIS